MALDSSIRAFKSHVLSVKKLSVDTMKGGLQNGFSRFFFFFWKQYRLSILWDTVESEP